MKFPLILSFTFMMLFEEQAQNLNQLDVNGKKHGKWEMYLSVGWKNVSSSKDATYLRYTYYDHGTNLYPFGTLGTKRYKLLHEGDDEKQANGLKLMNGTYKWLDKKGRLLFLHQIKNGEYVLYQDYRKAGELKTEMDYSQKYMEQEHTYKMTTYDKRGKPTVFFHQQTDKWGWIAYQAFNEPDSVDSKEVRVVGDTIFTIDRWYYDGKLYNEMEKIYFKGKGRGVYDGIFHGKYLAWYGNGNKEHEGEYHFGRHSEDWKSWDTEGNLREKK